MALIFLHTANLCVSKRYLKSIPVRGGRRKMRKHAGWVALEALPQRNSSTK
jgi:hypothetical protein